MWRTVRLPRAAQDNAGGRILVELSRVSRRSGATERCPYCHDLLSAGAAAEEPRARCEGCGTEHHAGCLAELGRCATHGCGAAVPGRAGARAGAGSGSGRLRSPALRAVRERIRERVRGYVREHVREPAADLGGGAAGRPVPRPELDARSRYPELFYWDDFARRLALTLGGGLLLVGLGAAGVLAALGGAPPGTLLGVLLVALAPAVVLAGVAVGLYGFLQRRQRRRRSGR